MSTHNDYRTDIDQWADMWDEMQSSGVHPEMEKPQPAPYSPGVTAQDHYYDYFDSEVDEELLQEEKTPNPVYPDSVGPDCCNPKPAWVKEDLLKEVESIKKRLFQVENQMARLGQGKKWSEKPVLQNGDKSLMSEVKKLRERLEKVSSKLGVEDEPSPWQIKRD